MWVLMVAMFRLYGRLEGGARRDREGRREDGPCGRVRGRAKADRHRRRELRRGELWYVLTSIFLDN